MNERHDEHKKKREGKKVYLRLTSPHFSFSFICCHFEYTCEVKRSNFSDRQGQQEKRYIFSFLKFTFSVKNEAKKDQIRYKNFLKKSSPFLSLFTLFTKEKKLTFFSCSFTREYIVTQEEQWQVIYRLTFYNAKAIHVYDIQSNIYKRVFVASKK